MAKLNRRRFSNLSILGVFWGLAIPTVASAQVRDAPISFHNTTDANVEFEILSVLKRNGEELLVGAKYQFDAGKLGVVEHEKEKLGGVTFTYLVRTHDDQRVTAWTAHNLGPDRHGNFRIDFTRGDLQEHRSVRPNPTAFPGFIGLEGDRFQPPKRSFLDRRSEFLAKLIAHTERAIAHDERRIRKGVTGQILIAVLGGTAKYSGDRSGKWLQKKTGELTRDAADATVETVSVTLDDLRQRVRHHKKVLIELRSELTRLQRPTKLLVGTWTTTLEFDEAAAREELLQIMKPGYKSREKQLEAELQRFITTLRHSNPTKRWTILLNEDGSSIWRIEIPDTKKLYSEQCTWEIVEHRDGLVTLRQTLPFDRELDRLFASDNGNIDLILGIDRDNRFTLNKMIRKYKDEIPGKYKQPTVFTRQSK